MNLSQDELLSQLRGMDEYEFEELVADVWEQRGWQTTVTTGSSDRGIDVIAEKSSPFSQKQLIQAKRYSVGNKIGSPDIQQYDSLRRQESDVDAVVVVTTSSFTSQAEQTANDLNVKLIGGEELSRIILNLDSQSFLSDYFSIGTRTTTKTEKSRQSTNDTGNDSDTGRTKDETGYYEIPSDGSDDLPDYFEKGEKTDEFGQFCPMCGEKNSIWKGKTADTDPLMSCEECDTRWTKKTGIIASTKWKVVDGDEKKTASEWKDTVNMDSVADTENNSVSKESTSENSATSVSSDVLDGFEKGGLTRKFGFHCPICGARDTIYTYINEDGETERMLICEKCETQWVTEQKSEKTGFLSGKRWIEWKAVGEDTTKKASEWKEMYR